MQNKLPFLKHMNNKGIQPAKKQSASDRCDKTELINVHPKAKKVKKMIDQKLANINPSTKIVEPAFQTIDFRKSVKFNKSNCQFRSSQSKIVSNYVLLDALKNNDYVVNANPVVEEKKIMMEKHIFARELYRKNEPDIESISQNFNDNESKNRSLILSPKKGRKLRKEYTLPPKPIKGTSVFSSEIKKYEAAKHYLLNQTTTTLAKACKQFNVSVPTLITYMDKSRVDAYIKTGKYSGNSAKREKRNIKNQYQEKTQAYDKWTETIQNLIAEAGSLEFYQDNDYYYFNNPFGRVTKEKRLRNHLAASKQFMKKIELKVQNEQLNTLNLPKSDSNNCPNSIHNKIHSDFSYLPNVSGSSLNPKALQLPAYTCTTNNILQEVLFSNETNFEEIQNQAPGVTNSNIFLNFSRPSSSYCPHISSHDLSNSITDWTEISSCHHVTYYVPKETRTLDFNDSRRKELFEDLSGFAIDNNINTPNDLENIQQNKIESSSFEIPEDLIVPPISRTSSKDENNSVLL